MKPAERYPAVLLFAFGAVFTALALAPSTDGMHLVAWISSEPVDLSTARILGWNLSTGPVLEGRGEYSEVRPDKN